MGSQIDYRLDGRSGIITGAANGIGRTLAVGLAEAGADIIVADLPVQRANAEETAEAVRRCGRKAMVVDMDVTDVSSIEAAVSSAVAEFGRVDFLVNNAGVNIRKPILEYTEDEWDKLSSVNLKGVFFCSQIVAKQMISQGGGRIVNIASQLATVAMRDRSIYAITKAEWLIWPKRLPSSWPVMCEGKCGGADLVSTPLTTSMFTDPNSSRRIYPRSPAGGLARRGCAGRVQFLLSPLPI